MPRIRCQKCGQAYDVPPAVAVRLPESVATCDCGQWLYGSKSALLARFSASGDVNEIDLSSYKIDLPAASAAPAHVHTEEEPFDVYEPRNVRIVARGREAAINTVFSISEHPLWIGRKGCHVELDDAELSIRHCSIIRHRNDLHVRDADSHTGTFMDGEQISEAVLGDGVHLLRVGGALISVEPTTDPGIPVEPIELAEEDLKEISPLLLKKLRERQTGRVVAQSGPKSLHLICLEGPLAGQEFEVPDGGVTVGREGQIRVPDEFLSRKHFTVFRDEQGTVRVRDLGSRNGTFLNTLPAKNTKIHPGDEIRAGVNRFRIEERPR